MLIRRNSIWHKVLRKFLADLTGIAGAVVVLLYFLAALGVWCGWWGTDWADLGGSKWEPVSAAHWSGGVLGAFAGFFTGSWIDELLLWVMNVLDAIPFYLFVAAVAYSLAGSAYAMHVAMITSFWIGTARLVRGEVIKLRNMEYIEAAYAIGLSQVRIIFRHILPNTSHILLVQASIAFVSAIKAEVILSFLGIGIRDGMSWGLMIEESTQEVLAGFYNNFIAASLLMFGLVMAFNALSDALQDAMDPRKVA
jgi:ABC-type dipeptide/oligopeptide/nickel transport system permease subunit